MPVDYSKYLDNSDEHWASGWFVMSHHGGNDYRCIDWQISEPSLDDVRDLARRMKCRIVVIRGHIYADSADEEAT